MLDLLNATTGIGAHDLAGVFGFVTYFASFGSVQLGKLDGNSALYSIANIVAATLVGISLLENFNLASALIQISWVLIGITGLTLRAWKAWPSTRRVLNSTLEEEAA